MQFGRGSSLHFVVALVLLNDGERVRQYVQEFRHRYGLADAELSFHNTPDRSRAAFFEGLLEFDVHVRATVLDKRALLPTARIHKMKLYVQLWNETLAWTVSTELLQRTAVILDEFDSPAVTISTLKRDLRRTHFSPMLDESLHSLRAARSHSEPLVQVADMAAGAVFRLVEEGDPRFQRIIRPKTLIWRWGENENPPG